MASNEVSQNFEYKNAGFLDASNGPFITKEAACLAIPNVVGEDGRNFREGKLPYIGVAPNLVRHEWKGGFEDFNLTPTPTISMSDVEKLTRIVEDNSKDIYFTDEKGHVIFQLSEDGTLRVKELYTQSLSGIDFPDTTMLSSLQDVPLQGFILTDENGYIGLRLDPSGKLYIKELYTQSFSSEKLVGNDLSVGPTDIINNQSPLAFSITDEDNNILWGIRNNGSRIEFGGANNVPVIKENPQLPSDIVHAISYGQSLSIGFGSTPITLTQKYNTVSFSGGVRTGEGSDGNPPNTNNKYTSLVPAIETIAETPLSGFANLLIEKLISEYDFSLNSQDFKLLISAPGRGGASIASLKKGTERYNQLIQDVTEGLARSNELGKTYTVGTVCWTQGEADFYDPNYYTVLKQLLIDINTDIKAITGQSDDVQFPMYQLASYAFLNGFGTPEAALNPHATFALAKICEDLPNAHLAVPAYIFDYPDNLHLDSVGYKWMGAYYAYTYKKTIIDKETYYPLSVKTILAQKNIIEITFNVPVLPLVFDTEWVSDPGNKGFRVTDNLGNPITINSVTIVRNDCVKLITSSNVSSGFHVQYGIGVTDRKSGRLNGPRGCLRDSQGDTIIFDKDGLNKPLHNWCLIFNKTI